MLISFFPRNRFSFWKNRYFSIIDYWFCAVMGKSQSRFDLNRDWIASRDSIWPLRIRFSSLRFEIWFDLGLLEIRFSVWRFGTKSYGNEPGAVADMRVSAAADHKWPTRNILELYFVRWLSPPFIAWQQSTSAFQKLMMTNLMIFVAVGYTLIVSKQEIWSRFEIWVIKIWDSGFFGDLRFGFATKDLRFYVWRFGIWHARFDLGFAYHWFCASLTSTDAAVTVCARPYIAAARKRTTDVRNGICGIGSADGMWSL